jgi:uncharacterized membrane protein
MDVSLLHPVINHFTIALLTLSVVFDVLGVITKNRGFHTAAWINLIFGAIAGIGTVMSGLIAQNNVAQQEAHRIMEIHESLGFIILGIAIILLVWRIVLKGAFPVKSGSLYVSGGVILVLLILVNGFYGGELVFKQGFAVKAAVDSRVKSGLCNGGQVGVTPDTTIERLTPEIVSDF